MAGPIVRRNLQQINDTRFPIVVNSNRGRFILTKTRYTSAIALWLLAGRFVEVFGVYWYFFGNLHNVPRPSWD